ncbi:pantetheinase-like [Uloborus diversus]|uniref:pantetheinase-like n=1 Tax=Uloborus diversus TaxID=327109 RepID=UPI00240A8DEB|nr:pantetheinase-like [Uloborus diversus]XP_054706095.1 pantetheinase-like [Uloborus diversus]
MAAYLELLMFAIIITSSCGTDGWFKVAVFEHARQGDSTPESAQSVISTNLDFYKRAATVAKAKATELIVYPEYGIFAPQPTRAEIREFLESIPDPEVNRTNPCNEPERYQSRPILYTLSCIAEQNRLIVVANMGEITHCDNNPECPDDGAFHLNTNVVFDKDGTLIFRYHKEHLFFELALDLPKENHNPVFTTELGTFATFIAFDLVFKKAAEVARRPDVDAVLCSTYWINSFSLHTSIQFWESWAIGNKATFLAANVQAPGYLAVGSGIFKGKNGSLAYTLYPDGISKLLVAEISRKSASNVHRRPLESSVTLITKDGSYDWQGDGKDLPKECDDIKQGKKKDNSKEFQCFKESLEKYSLIKLSQPKGHAQACNNQMCCSVNYVTSGLKSNFYLAVFNGTHNSFDRYFWVEENCFLARCDILDGERCDFQTKSKTRFHSLHLTANFTTSYVYPSVMSSGSRLVPVHKWNITEYLNTQSINFYSLQGLELLVASFKGRCYDRDPPYVR